MCQTMCFDELRIENEFLRWAFWGPHPLLHIALLLRYAADESPDLH